MKKISFIIPCYGSEKTIENVTLEIIEKINERKKEFDYEIVCVNDFSKDNVLEVLKKLAKKDKKIKVISFTKNMNRPSAIMAGLKYSSGDYCVMMDDDGQCPMQELWKLIDPLEEEDVVMAKYPERKQGIFKNFGTAMNKMMTRFFLDRPKGLEFTNFVAMRRVIAEEMVKYDNPYPYITGLLLRSTGKIKNVQMEERNRLAGSTTFSFKKMLDLWLNGITAFSIKPLRISTFLGALIATGGFIYGIVLLVQMLCGADMPTGYASIIAWLLLIGGIIMIMLGIIGEYIGRIYISINNSPQYVIKEKINFDDKK